MAGREQRGVEQKRSGSWYFLYRDAAGKRLCEKLGPAEGPGKLSRQERWDRKRKILEQAFPDKQEQDKEQTKSCLSFRMGGESWLHHSMTRRRKPIRQNTARIYAHYLNRWLYPAIGDTLLSDVKNMQAKAVIDKMHAAGASTSVIEDVITIIQQVVASVKDADGQPIYDVKWDRDVMDAPEVKQKETKAFTPEEIEAILDRLIDNQPYFVLFAFLCATGVRIGEALALEIDASPETATTLSKDCRVLYVNKIILQEGTKQDCPKTQAGVREVDIHPEMAELLKDFIGLRTSGYLFSADSGNPLQQGNIRKNVLDSIIVGCERKKMKRVGKGWKCVGVDKIPGVCGEKRGFHACRRSRETHLRLEGVPQPIIDFWTGHGKKTISDVYTKVKQMTGKRREWCEKAGLGFSLPTAKVVEIKTKTKGKVKAA